MEYINLVDSSGNRIGSIEKLEAHVDGKLHEAFSIFVFNTSKELLLQRRALDKYHSGGLWTNTCCSHARVGEALQEAVHRRLKEEMGFDCHLEEAFSFEYRAEHLTNDLIENEFDHVFIGHADPAAIEPDPEEVAEYAWVNMDDLERDMRAFPEKYTEWLKVIMSSGRLRAVI